MGLPKIIFRKPPDCLGNETRVEADAFGLAGFVRHVRLRGLVFRFHAEGDGVFKRTRVGAAANGERLGFFARRFAVDGEQRFDQLAVGSI
jgi:hypothetical protein